MNPTTGRTAFVTCICACALVAAAAAFVGCAEPTAGAAGGPVAPAGGKLDNSAAAGGGSGQGQAKGGATAGGAPQVVARVGNRTVTLQQLQAPLFEAHGLSVLLSLMELELAEQAAQDQGLEVTQEDVTAERDAMLGKVLSGAEEKMREQVEDLRDEGELDKAAQLEDEMRRQREGLLDQFLAENFKITGEYISRPQFELAVRLNAVLRKLTEHALEGQEVPEEDLRKLYAATYGEKAVVRHIQLANPKEVMQAQRRLARGEAFAKVAQAMSRNPVSAQVGGELPAFTRDDQAVPQTFRDAAFSLEPGQVSDPVQTGDAFHLILLEDRLTNERINTFEDVRDSVEAEYRSRQTELLMQRLRAQFGQQIVAGMEINEPVLKKQFTRRLEASRKASITDPQEIDEQMRRDRAAQAAEAGGGALSEVDEAPVERPKATTKSKAKAKSKAKSKSAKKKASAKARSGEDSREEAE